MPDHTVIGRRFRGPAASGNGGYSCGLIAKEIAGVGEGAAEVKLTAPPPLEKELTLAPNGQGVAMLDGDTVIGVGAAAARDLDPPPSPGLDAARAGVKRFAAYDNHALPECFVCGTHREPPDALCLYTGPFDASGVVAAPWTPAAEFADENGDIRTEIIWAALDCPSYFGLQKPGLMALLGKMTAQIYKAPKAGEECVIAGWAVERDGRKHFAASALYNADGDLLGKARTTWIELKQ